MDLVGRFIEIIEDGQTVLINLEKIVFIGIEGESMTLHMENGISVSIKERPTQKLIIARIYIEA